jgi:hypothetical protein
MNLIEAESPGSPGNEFLHRVRRAARSVLGDSPAGRKVMALCDDHERARELILKDRSGGALVVAVVGATGQGKSWLVRQLIRRSPLAANVRSGNSIDQSTDDLVWIGPFPPTDLDSRYERYLRVSADEMEPLGTPYLLVDAPGATDERAGIVDVARRALSLASALLLVVRRDQIRACTPSMLAVASEGTVVIPVINTVGQHDSALKTDLDAFLGNLRHAAPESVIARPIEIPDFEVGQQEEAAVGQAAAEETVHRLQIELQNNPDSDRRRSTRLSALDERFRAALCGLMSESLPSLKVAVDRLNEEATKLPGEVASSLVGSAGPLRAAVRSRLRLELLTSTAAIWFPYRTLLGLLNLTHGAWDRMLLSLSGSLPSLVSTIWSTSRSLTSDRNANEEMREGLRRRSTAAVTDRLGPLASQFRDELAMMQSRGRNEPHAYDAAAQHDVTETVASLAGLDALQERSQQIFEETIDAHSVAKSTATLMAIVGTLLFWALMAGPFVALYSEYLKASFDSLVGGRSSMDHFPHPEFAMIATSLVLSLLPTALFAMVALSISQSNGRVAKSQRMIRDRHNEIIEQLQRERVLRLEWTDPVLSDAEFLLSAGEGVPR